METEKYRNTVVLMVLIDTWWNVNVFFRRLIGCNTEF